MKRIYTIIVLVVLGLGVWFFMGTKPQQEAEIQQTQGEASVVPAENVTENVAGDILEDSGRKSDDTVQTVKEFTIMGNDFSFKPDLITVKKGDKVKITFENSAGFHDFKIDEYGVATKQAKSPSTEVLEFTVDKVGSFEYYCSVGNHRVKGMKGSLVVEG